MWQVFKRILLTGHKHGFWHAELIFSKFRHHENAIQHSPRVKEKGQKGLWPKLHESYRWPIDVLIGRLRKRLRDDGKEPALIKTVRGEGYVLAASVEAL